MTEHRRHGWYAGYVAAVLFALAVFLFGLLLASLPVAANTAVLLL